MMRRWLAALVACGFLAASCMGAADRSTGRTSQSSCILSASYERGTELSGRAWDYLSENLDYFIDNEGVLFSAAVLYTRGFGRAAFDYRTDCPSAQRRVERAFAYLAHRAPDPEVGDVLRQANATWRVIDQTEFEDAEAPNRPAGEQIY